MTKKNAVETKGEVKKLRLKPVTVRDLAPTKTAAGVKGGGAGKGVTASNLC
jgi:hypothetical protein